MLIVTLAWEIIPVNRWHHLISLQFPLVSNSFSTSAIFHTPSKVEFWQEGSILRFLIVYCLSACILFVFCLSFEYIKCTQPSLDNCITYVQILSETLPPLLTSPNAPVRFIWWCQPLFFSGRKRRLGLLGAKRTTITVHRYRQLSSSHEKWQFLCRNFKSPLDVIVQLHMTNGIQHLSTLRLDSAMVYHSSHTSVKPLQIEPISPSLRIYIDASRRHTCM